MKVKFFFTALVASAILLTSTLGVSAANVIETNEVDWPMSQKYSKTTKNGSGYMYYHVGTIPYINYVSAYSETKVASGMSGYASVQLKAANNKISIKYSDKVINGSYIRTDSAGISNELQAENVKFTGARKDIGQDYVGYNYYIY